MQRESYSSPDPPESPGVIEEAGSEPLEPLRVATGVVPTLVCVDPSTGEPMDEIARATAEDVDQAVEAAEFAFALWRGTPFRERTRFLHRLADLIHERADDIAELITAEQGKPTVEALSMEVLPALDQLRYLAAHAEQAWSSNLVRPRHPLYTQKRMHYLYEPLGIVAVVTPFNLPFMLPLMQSASAVAMGNAVLLKPSEQAPLCGIRIGDLYRDAGFPQGLVNVLPADRGDSLYVVAHPEVEKVFFTGSPGTGQRVMATVGCIPREVVLNLGGNHPAVVAADADLDRAARGIVWGALANCGQNCGSVERVYVEDAIASRFLERVLTEVGDLNVGDPKDPDVDMGPMISDEHRQAVHERVTEAVEGGARLLRGGEIPEGPGFFYPPTVLLAPPEDCRLMREETLGPVIPIVVVESLERAILLANDNDHGLTASGWTGMATTADRLMIGLHAGVVTINDVLYPFGEPAASKCGFRMSGFGPFQGIAGLREMSRRKLASFDPVRTSAPVFSFPYDASARDDVKSVMERLHAGRLTRRIRALCRLFRARRFRSRVPSRFFFLKRMARR